MGNNYTVTIYDNDMPPAENLTWRDMYLASFSFNSPFTLILENKSVLTATQVLRILPKKRMVVSGKWENKEVVAKLFFDPTEAKRHFNADVAGIQILQQHNIPTPAICYQGYDEEDNIQVLILEKIADGKNLTTYLSTLTASERRQCLERVILELATQHVLGVLQQDLHFDNFLLTDKVIYTLDGSQISQHAYLLPKKLSMNNLALLLSQLGIGMESEQAALFYFYAKSRGWLLKEYDIADLFFMIRQCNRVRWKNFSEKLTRHCSDFIRIKKWGARGMVTRSYQGEALSTFLHSPGQVFRDPNTVILKAGRSTTVVKVTLNGYEFVIKRYNTKNFFHWLKRLFRESRAKKNWRMAQKLNFFGVATAKPVAFIETGYFGLPAPSYFVTAYKPHVPIGVYFEQYDHSTNQLSTIITAVMGLFKKLAKLQITHGDLKASNILIDEHHEPFLIDLDGATFHLSSDSLHAVWKKDMMRFLKNFKHQPLVYDSIKAAWADKKT